MAEAGKSESAPHGGGQAAMALLALGIVFGDIGTSPLYAFKESLHAVEGWVADDVLGLLSMMAWSLVLVVTVKYVWLVMRVDNQGEGGILALLALLAPEIGSMRPRIGRTTLLLIFGACLLYGDGMLTPSITVLSAVEGLELAAPDLHAWVVPVSCAILVVLFALQKYGTERIGLVFGPVMVVWFGAIGLLGLCSVAQSPGVLWALDPSAGVRFAMRHGWHTVTVLGAVVLVFTGAEALYADLGHFGRRAISVAWHRVALPCLLLNYLGQGALVLRDPSAAANPFYALAPEGFLRWALLGLATAAAIIASQALISGAYSLTRQAVLMGFCPRVEILHTSARTEGQIYLPTANWMLGAACVGMVLIFRSSSAMASAYGIAVVGTMLITTLALGRVATLSWGWPTWKAGMIIGPFVAVDLLFLAGNWEKFPDGGYFPIVVAAGLFSVMMTWKAGRSAVGREMAFSVLSLPEFIESVNLSKPVRVAGTAVFMSGRDDGMPITLAHFFKINKILHERVLILTVSTANVPRVQADGPPDVTDLGHGFYRVRARYGYMEEPDAPDLVRRVAAKAGFPFKPMDTYYVFNREVIIHNGRSGLWPWQVALFDFLSRNARPPRSYFRVPPGQMTELSTPVHL